MYWGECQRAHYVYIVFDALITKLNFNFDSIFLMSDIIDLLMAFH